MNTPTQAQYEANEAKQLAKLLQEVEAIKGEDAQEGREQYMELLCNASMMQERLGWLFEGSYGYGAQKKAIAIAEASKRTNKTAQLCMLLAALDCSCKRYMAASAWKALGSLRKVSVAYAVDNAIAIYERDIKEA